MNVIVAEDKECNERMLEWRDSPANRPEVVVVVREREAGERDWR